MRTQLVLFFPKPNLHFMGGETFAKPLTSGLTCVACDFICIPLACCLSEEERDTGWWPAEAAVGVETIFVELIGTKASTTVPPPTMAAMAMAGIFMVMLYCYYNAAPTVTHGDC